MINIDENKKAIEILDIIKSKVDENKNLISEKNKDINDTLNEYYAYGTSSGDYGSELGMLSQLNYAKSINNIANRQLERYLMMLKKPYFGRVDFQTKNDESAYYFGIETLIKNNEVIINDWRSPIGNLYYECGYGKASYESPLGRVEGNINLKRQYRFEDGKLLSFVDTGLNISDELLIDILGQNNEVVMKNIVSTIQKEQNRAIRYNDENDLLVVGVAGSGKTSIALHRIAYLVYKDSVKYDSSKICFITPNDIFYKYVDNVLPELGEQNVVNLTLNETARIILKMDLYKSKLKLENKVDFLEKVINGKKNIDFDSLFSKLNEFLENKLIVLFNDKLGLKLKDITFKSEIFKELYFNKFKRRNYSERKKLIKEYLKDRISNKRKITKNILDVIDTFVDRLLPEINYFDVYKEFLDSIKYEGEIIRRNIIGYEHIYPLCYIKTFFKKCKLFDKYNHLLIDEYQDLNIFERNVINNLFDCNKTFVGDFNQKLFFQNYVDSYSGFKVVELNESYRSTLEIFNFLQDIIQSKGVNGVKRKGENVKIINFDNEKKQLEYLKEVVSAYKGKSMAIVCKNLKRATKLYLEFKDSDKVTLLDMKGKEIKRGIIIGPISLVKGLEFDKVVVIDASDDNYKNEIDRNYFYIACSRAINELEVICSGNFTTFIKDNYEKDFK